MKSHPYVLNFCAKMRNKAVTFYIKIVLFYSKFAGFVTFILSFQIKLYIGGKQYGNQQSRILRKI